MTRITEEMTAITTARITIIIIIRRRTTIIIIIISTLRNFETGA